MTEKTGFFRVIREETFGNVRYYYRISNELVKDEISNRSILKLKLLVEEEGYLWGIVDYDLAYAIAKDEQIPINLLVGNKGIQHDPKATNGFLTTIRPFDLYFVPPNPNWNVSRGSYSDDYSYRKSFEKRNGVKLPSNINVHHINCDKSDTRPINLIACSATYHGFLHHLLYKARVGFVQEISKASPIIYKINNIYVYSFITGSTFDTGYACGNHTNVRSNLGYVLYDVEIGFITSTSLDQLKYIIDASRLYWSDEIPIIKINLERKNNE